MGYYNRFPKYVSVSERQNKAEKKIKSLKKKGSPLHPVVIEGKSIAKTFWGKAWCKNLESYRDYENRLPRGRSYVRNGFVIDLQIKKGSISAQVIGSSLYRVEISIAPIEEIKWTSIIKTCTGKIDSLLELLQGKFSKAVMTILTDPTNGLFPKPHEIKMTCSCPDYAGMCKHIAATLYGVGSLLDTQPENLFTLRHVNHTDLISVKAALPSFTNAQESNLGESDLGALFGIDIETEQPTQKPTAKKKTSPAKKTKPKQQKKG